jgi:hypothetical protein
VTDDDDDDDDDDFSLNGLSGSHLNVHLANQLVFKQ